MPSLFRRTFIQNFGIKLVSLLLAIGLWLVVSRDPVGEVELQVPIEFRNVPQNLEIDSASFTQAQIRVRGPGRLIHRLRSTDIRAEIDLGSVTPGTRTFDLTSRNVRVPSDIEIVQIIPSQFQLSFDDRMRRSIEVVPQVSGAGGRQLRVITEPSTITITGPKRRIETAQPATTDPVDVSGVTDRATFITQAYVPDPLIQVVHPTPIHVTVIMERGDSH